MGDTSRHLTYFKVENFKRFESFEMNDLGQFNLIVGDNNVGKTSVLEALLFDEDTWSFVNNLFKSLQFRNLKSKFYLGDIELYLNKELTKDERLPLLRFSWNERNKEDRFIQITIDRNQQQIFFVDNNSEKNGQRSPGTFYTHQDFNFNSNLNFPFMPFYKGHDSDLTRFYSRVQEDKKLKNFFNDSLKIIAPTIESIALSNPYQENNPHLIVYQNHINSSIPLALFGDGMIKLFRLLVEMILNRGKRLMIDEIDTGIHFSRFKEFWRIVLKSAKENDVQLFMTTHNEECIKYFIEALNEMDSDSFRKDARNISLVQLPDKTIKAYTYTFDQLEANIIQGNEVRGGAR